MYAYNGFPRILCKHPFLPTPLSCGDSQETNISTVICICRERDRDRERGWPNQPLLLGLSKLLLLNVPYHKVLLASCASTVAPWSTQKLPYVTVGVIFVVFVVLLA